MQRAVVCIALLASLLVSSGGHSQERGVAYTDPGLMERLERQGFSLSALLAPIAGRAAVAATSNSAIFALRPMTPIRNAIQKELANLREGDVGKRDPAFEPYEPRVMATVLDTPGQAFNYKYIVDPASRLELTGIVNRMDRAFVVRNDHPGTVQQAEATCGEIRFIYRFTYDIDPRGDPKSLQSRLPLTMNLVMNARRTTSQSALPCTTIARRWKAFDGTPLRGDALAAALVGANGPLAELDGRNIDRIEFNMQALRLKVAHKPDMGGHAEYLLKVFRWDPINRIFQESRLENQIDRDRMIRREATAGRFEPGLLARFKQWLLRPEVMASLDNGTLLIRDEYLATRGVSVAPGGASRSQNDPFRDMFSDPELEEAFTALRRSGHEPRTLLSPASFRLRLAQTSCSGCHQARAIAGFHFPGADRADDGPSAFPSNEVFVPASAHFFGDLPRRRAIVDAFATGAPRDYFRYFPSRADERHRDALAGTQLLEGWGAACHRVEPGQVPDEGLKGWTCAPDLECKVLHAAPTHARLGVCVGKHKVQIGDPLEFGTIDTAAYGVDTYTRDVPDGTSKPDPPAGCGPTCVASHQQLFGNAGGFPAGMLRLNSCAALPAEASCGRVASDGFNDCVSKGIKTFKECLISHNVPAGLRACDRNTPCREDYICTARHEGLQGAKPGKGTCIPPYFMFQFRSDGHPRSWTPVTADD